MGGQPFCHTIMYGFAAFQMHVHFVAFGTNFNVMAQLQLKV
jgi:hypothetical protein